MKKNSYNYCLPEELIAQKPTTKRDSSKLMIINRQKKTIDAEHHFFDLPKFLDKNDVLVFNNSKVFPARLLGQKQSGGKAEVFLLTKINKNGWECLIGAHGQKTRFNYPATKSARSSAQKTNSQINLASNF